MNKESNTENGYLKINTLFKREFGKKAMIIPNEYSLKEFESINRWLITEKLHGQNTRIIYEPETKRLYINGKTDEAKFDSDGIYDFIAENITVEKMAKKFPFNPDKPIRKVILYGESIGYGILDFDKFYGENRIVIFDINIDEWWLEQRAVESISHELGLETAPVIAIMTTEEMIKYVMSEPKSVFIDNPNFVMEGIVATSYPMMMFRDNGEKLKPIKTKLKVSDFRQLKARNNEEYIKLKEKFKDV